MKELSSTETTKRKLEEGRVFRRRRWILCRLCGLANRTRWHTRARASAAHTRALLQHRSRDLDIALVKHTYFGEKFYAELRANVFDITNTPAFAHPNGSFGSAAFGGITATITDPRVLQFVLRLSR
jgi:hypothetical protein